MVTCTGHIGIHEGADGRTYGRKMTSWLFYQIFSHRWVTSIFLAMVLRARGAPLLLCQLLITVGRSPSGACNFHTASVKRRFHK